MHLGEQRQTKENAVSNGVRSLFVLICPRVCLSLQHGGFGPGGGEGGGVLGVIFAGYVLLASQNP